MIKERVQMGRGDIVMEDAERENLPKKDLKDEGMEYSDINNSESDTWQEVKKHDRRAKGVIGEKRAGANNVRSTTGKYNADMIKKVMKEAVGKKI
jgi:hypothetical protein